LTDPLAVLAAIDAAIDETARLEGEGWEKSPGEWVTERDISIETILSEYLVSLMPGSRVLGEEAASDADGLLVETNAGSLWVVDPIDGTANYVARAGPVATMVALSVDGAPALGAVALPGLGLTLASEPQALPAVAPKLRMLVSRTRPAKEAVAVAEALGAELVPMGSAGAKAMAVLRGEADIYLHTGGQYEWDNCAPAAVALAAGLHASRADGSPLVYNNENPYLPDLLICQKHLAPRVLEALAA